MSYYSVKVKFETGDVNKAGDPVSKISQFLVADETVIGVEKKVAEYMSGTLGSYETTQITKTKIEAVIFDKDRYEEIL
jgi:hypothetical protein